MTSRWRPPSGSATRGRGRRSGAFRAGLLLLWAFLRPSLLADPERRPAARPDPDPVTPDCRRRLDAGVVDLELPELGRPLALLGHVPSMEDARAVALDQDLVHDDR